MTLLLGAPCVGRDDAPCVFSIVKLGRPRLCFPPNVRCCVCRGAPSPRTLALLYILDTSTYQRALGKVCDREKRREQVRRELNSMMPARGVSIGNLRHERASLAIDGLLQAVMGGPFLLERLKDESRSMAAAMMSLRTKNITRDAFLSILDYIVVLTPSVLCEQLADVKQAAYTISRHPAFRAQWMSENELSMARAYMAGVMLHRKHLVQLAEIMRKQSSLLRRCQRQSHIDGNERVLSLIGAMIAAPVLSVGATMCHESFEPREFP